MAQIKDIMQTKSSILRSYFVFTIENFTDLNDNSINSSQLKIENNIWFIVVYPRNIKDNVEYTQVFLRLKESERPVVYANYSVSIINAKNKLINEFIDKRELAVKYSEI